jgi:Fe2+ or Zn2+ uptake regulation protein
LLEALLAGPGHRSAEQLAADIQARAPGVNLSTIYRNLDELERLKIVDRTHLGHGPATYTSPKPPTATWSANDADP